MSFLRPKTAFVTGRNGDTAAQSLTVNRAGHHYAVADSPDLAYRRPRTAALLTPGSSTPPEASSLAESRNPTTTATTSSVFAAPGAEYVKHRAAAERPVGTPPAAPRSPASPSRAGRPKTAGIAPLRPVPNDRSGSPRISSPLANTARPASGGGVRSAAGGGSPLTTSKSLADVLESVGDGPGSSGPHSPIASLAGSPHASPRPPSGLSSPHATQRPTTASPGSAAASLPASFQKSGALLKESALLRDTVATNRAEIRSATQLDGCAALRTKSHETVFSSIRDSRDESAQLQQAICRLGEEQKLLGKCKCLLEVAIQDKRKGMSVNHQSQALRQKMSARDQRLTDSSSVALASEARHLSQCKRDLEKQLAQVKNQQWEVDKLRKTITSRSDSIKSGPLALDAHHEKILSFPYKNKDRYTTSRRKPVKAVQFNAVVTASDDPATNTAVSRSPLTATKGVQSSKIVAQSQSLIEASRTLREESKRLIASVSRTVDKRKEESNSALKASSDKAHAQECELGVERGRARHARSASAHALGTYDIAAARARGPVADADWSVAEKSSRPLLQVKPELGEDEEKLRKKSIETFTVLSSSSAAAVDKLSKVDNRLAVMMRQQASLRQNELEVLRMRRRSADNRWVKG
eukprot:scpid38610/ scgid35140/ 